MGKTCIQWILVTLSLLAVCVTLKSTPMFAQDHFLRRGIRLRPRPLSTWARKTNGISSPELVEPRHSELLIQRLPPIETAQSNSTIHDARQVSYEEPGELNSSV